MAPAKLVALGALLYAATAVTAHEVEWNQRVSFFNVLDKRDSSFKAPEVKKPGTDCNAAFGAGYVTCREKSDAEIRLCYNPSIGQVCCDNSWGCPAGSFCLTKGLCCPAGIAPAACAASYSVPVPTSLTTSDSGPASSSAPPPPPPTTTPTPEPVSYCPAPPLTSVVSPIPYPAQNTTLAPPVTATATGTVTATATTSMPVFTGAASSVQLGGLSGIAAALLAVAQLL